MLSRCMLVVVLIVIGLVTICFVVLTGCGPVIGDLNILGDDGPEANADFGAGIFIVIQSGDTLGHMGSNGIVLEPEVPFEVHFVAAGDPGVLKVQLVHDECGKVHECGSDYPNCPTAEWRIDGSGKVGVRVSGLPGGREYQMYFRYIVDGGGGIVTCRWLDLSAYQDTSGNISGIRVEPILR